MGYVPSAEVGSPSHLRNLCLEWDVLLNRLCRAGEIVQSVKCSPLLLPLQLVLCPPVPATFLAHSLDWEAMNGLEEQVLCLPLLQKGSRSYKKWGDSGPYLLWFHFTWCRLIPILPWHFWVGRKSSPETSSGLSPSLVSIGHPSISPHRGLSPVWQTSTLYKLGRRSFLRKRIQVINTALEAKPSIYDKWLNKPQ